MDRYSLFAFLASILAIIGYFPYIRDIRAGKTKPHMFSWFVWTLMTGIYLFAQLSDGAGIGALTMGVTTLMSLYIIIISIRKSERTIKLVDWISFIISLIALVSWILVKTPLYAVILIVIADIAAFMPTFRKSYNNPNSETVETFAIAALKHVLSIFSLQSITFISSFYTFYLIFINTVFVSMLIIRRRVLDKGQ